MQAYDALKRLQKDPNNTSAKALFEQYKANLGMVYY